jgi:signal transduction histidine kinase
MGAGSQILGEERRHPPRGTVTLTPPGTEHLREQVRVLQEISRAFGATPDQDQAEIATARWAREAVGDPEASVRIVRADTSGKLVVHYAEGELGSALDHDAVSVRAFEACRVVREAVPSEPGHEVAAFPLVTRGTAVGVLEVITTRDRLASRESILTAVASHAAILFCKLEHEARLRREASIAEGLADLARELLTADSREVAVKAVVRFCAEQLSLPVGLWRGRDNESGMQLTAVRGVSPGGQEALRKRLESIASWGELSDAERSSLLDRFARAVSHPAASAIAAGDSVLILAGAEESRALQVLRELLTETLGYIGYIDRARRRDEELDLALAWTAHEIRQPLVGVRAHVENLLYEGGPVDREMVDRLLAEIDELSSMVEPVLGYTSGASSLDLEPADLPALVQEVVASLSPQESERVRVTGPDRLVAPVDGGQFRMALSNVIHNALMYSPPESGVEVRLQEADRDVTLRIVDRGPGVVATEWDRIFDPFVRGRAGAGYARGKGLGLFIARRVIEAHRGRIWIEPAEKGAVFTIRIPTHGGYGDQPRPGGAQVEGVPAKPSV